MALFVFSKTLGSMAKNLHIVFDPKMSQQFRLINESSVFYQPLSCSLLQVVILMQVHIAYCTMSDTEEAPSPELGALVAFWVTRFRRFGRFGRFRR